MKIKEVKIYQSAKFEGKQVTFFTIENKETAHYHMEAGQWGVRVRSDKDDVIVGYANIAYMKPVAEPVVEQKEKKKA